MGSLVEDKDLQHYLRVEAKKNYANISIEPRRNQLSGKELVKLNSELNIAKTIEQDFSPARMPELKEVITPEIQSLRKNIDQYSKRIEKNKKMLLKLQRRDILKS